MCSPVGARVRVYVGECMLVSLEKTEEWRLLLPHEIGYRFPSLPCCICPPPPPQAFWHDMLDVAHLTLTAKAVDDLLRFPRSQKETRIPIPWKEGFSGSKNPHGAWLRYF